MFVAGSACNSRHGALIAAPIANLVMAINVGAGKADQVCVSSCQKLEAACKPTPTGVAVV